MFQTKAHRTTGVSLYTSLLTFPGRNRAYPVGRFLSAIVCSAEAWPLLALFQWLHWCTCSASWLSWPALSCSLSPCRLAKLRMLQTARPHQNLHLLGGLRPLAELCLDLATAAWPKSKVSVHVDDLISPAPSLHSKQWSEDLTWCLA